MKQSINCLCGIVFSIEIKEEIDLDKESKYLEEINNGTFMSFTCSGCGKKHKPEYKITLLWKSKNLKLEVLPEPERGEFYRRKKEKFSLKTFLLKTFSKDKTSKEKVSIETVSLEKVSLETVIGYPEMADRIAVINDDLEPVVIETLKYYLLAKAEENYPDREINAWYHGKGEAGIEFHLDGIRAGEVAVMKVPWQVYDRTRENYRKRPKNKIFTSLRSRSYLSVQNLFISDVLK